MERAVVRVRGAMASRVPRPLRQGTDRRHDDPRRVSGAGQDAEGMKILNPATGAAIADVPEDGPAAVHRKYERARAAQPGWAATPIRQRLAAIAGFRERVVTEREALARTLTQEVGKPIRQS